MFSRPSGSWLVFTLSSHWLLIEFSFLVIGCSDCVGFGFTSLNWKALFLLRRPFCFCLRRTSNIFGIRKEDLTQFVVTFQQTELLGKLSGFKSLSYVQGLLFKVTYVATDRHSQFLCFFVEIVSFLYAILMNDGSQQSSSCPTLPESTINLVIEALGMLNFMGTVDLKVLQVSVLAEKN